MSQLVVVNDSRRVAPAIINSMPALLTSVPTPVPSIYIKMGYQIGSVGVLTYADCNIRLVHQ